VLTKSVKIDQSEGIPEQPFVKFAHRRCFASSHPAFFSCADFCTAPQLTERLEEARAEVEVRPYERGWHKSIFVSRKP